MFILELNERGVVIKAPWIFVLALLVLSLKFA